MGQTDSDMTHNDWTQGLKARLNNYGNGLTRDVTTHIGGATPTCMYMYINMEITAVICIIIDIG